MSRMLSYTKSKQWKTLSQLSFLRKQQQQQQQQYQQQKCPAMPCRTETITTTFGTNSSSNATQRNLSTDSSYTFVKVDQYNAPNSNADTDKSTATQQRKIPEDGLTLSDFVRNHQQNPSGQSVISSSSSSSSSRGTMKYNNNNKNNNSKHHPTVLSFHLKTYGCQMNVNDSDIVRAILLESGRYVEAPSEEEADIWLTNTCAIRDRAEQKVWQRLRTLKRQKKERNQRNKKQSNKTTTATATATAAAATPFRKSKISNTPSTADTFVQQEVPLQRQDEEFQLQHPRTHYKSQQKIVGLLGCMAERLKDDLFQEDDLVDVVVGPDAYRDLPRLLDSIQQQQQQQQQQQHQQQRKKKNQIQAMNVELSTEETYSDIVPVRERQSSLLVDPSNAFSQSAFVSIQRGCSNRCSFCIVPFTRGGLERSRPLESIVSEIELLHHTQGIQEVVLLGQNVNSYHDTSPDALAARPNTTPLPLSNTGFRSRVRRNQEGGYSFVDLVERVSDISPELRVRFTSPHPKDYPHDLLHIMAERPNVCNQLHLPAQSGSTTMLKRMKRGYTREAYLELIDTVHSIIPDVALSSDFIAGFCDETQEEHEDTVQLLQQVQYDQAFLFAYSMREKTVAHRTMKDTVPANIKQERLQELINTFRTTIHAKNERQEVGRVRLVLVEGPSKRQMGTDDYDGTGMTATWHGRTDQNKRIFFPVAVSKEHNSLDAIHAPAMTWNGDWITSQLQTGSMNVTPFLFTNPDTISSVPSTSKATLVPGEYAAVQVTEAKGHTLRGNLLWKTTLQKFSQLEHAVLSKLVLEQQDSNQQQQQQQLYQETS